MIKLQDFARQMGVTDRAVQKHLKKYADELDGLYQRKGPNGTWLTDEACEILRSKMRLQPMAVGDAQIYRELEEAEKKIAKLQDEKANLAAMNSILSDWKAEKAVAIAAADQTKLLLDATKAELDQVKLDLALKDDEVAKAVQKAADVAQKAEEAEQRADQAEQEKEEYRRWLEDAEDQLAALKSRGLFARILRIGE